MFTWILRGRRAIKRSLKVRSRSRRSQHPRRERAVRLALFFGAIVATGLFYPQSELYSPVRIPHEGKIAREDFIAPAVITLKKSDVEIADERDAAARAAPIVLDYDSTVVDSAVGQLQGFTTAATRLRARLKRDGVADFGVFAEELTRQFPYLSSLALKESFHEESLAVVSARLATILRDKIYFHGALPSLEALEAQPNRPVVMRVGGRETIVTRATAMDLKRARSQLLDELNQLVRDTALNVELHYEIGRHFIFANLKVARLESARRQNEAVAAVSDVKYQVQEGDLVVRAGQVVTDREVALIREYAAQMQRLALQENFFKANLPILVRMLLIAIVFGLLYLYLKVFREDIYRSVPKLVAVFLIVAVELAGVYLCETQEWNHFIFPVALAPI
ncbi:MAG TPA: hypothetical protein VLB27_08770, partial [candidate division Zixibacteria bacterium]|nr:hypothetical protein [candidate division Zixibacteria bacterium]